MNRRSFLQVSGVLTLQTALASGVIESLWTYDAHGAPVSLAGLHDALPPTDGEILVPSDADFAKYQVSYNKRTMKTPLARVRVHTAEGTAIAIQWARKNNVPLAVRSGGHSFEGLSQTTGLAIDTKPMHQIDMASDNNSFVTGAGTMLGDVYTSITKHNRVIPAGSCPPVGVTGHTLGGGYGLVARAFGLACDSLIQAEIVNAEGKILTVNDDSNADLFWALRGGGAGSFGVVTQLEYKTDHIDSNVTTYGISWELNPVQTLHLMQAWQHWAPQSPREITSLMKVARGRAGLYSIRAVGQSIGSVAKLKQELTHLTSIIAATPVVKTIPVMDAVLHFAGSFKPESIYMKGKSDYLTSVMTNEAIATFLKNMPLGVAVIFDSYGGAISDVKNTETAFAHRQGYLSSLQYYTQWENASETPAKLAMMRKFHDSMRPYMSGAAYFNYCDLDLKDYSKSYWGENLPRLMDIKAVVDPHNVFRHAQSIPVKG